MDFAAARHNMVESQIRTNRVTDTFVIDALEDIPREAFAPEDKKAIAYIDEDIIVGEGRIMMEPMVLARLLQAAEIEDTDVALVVAAATGFEAACAARLASAVVALESPGPLADQARAALTEQGADTVSLVQGEVTKGHPGQAPFDVILINGSVADVPVALVEQLADGGRLVCVKTGTGRAAGKAVLVSKAGQIASERVLFDASIPALPEFAAGATFTF